MRANTNPTDSTTGHSLFESNDVSYDPATDTYTTPFDGETDPDSVVVGIAETVAEATDNDPTEIPSLYASVHTGALTQLVSQRRERDVEVSFTYDGCRVTVVSDGEIVVRPLDQ